jgi:hypothetical protein
MDERLPQSRDSGQSGQDGAAHKLTGSNDVKNVHAIVVSQKIVLALPSEN